MHIISAVGLFCYHKFEETPNEKVVNMSKFTKPYFRMRDFRKVLQLEIYLFPKGVKMVSKG